MKAVIFSIALFAAFGFMACAATPIVPDSSSSEETDRIYAENDELLKSCMIKQRLKHHYWEDPAAEEFFFRQEENNRCEDILRAENSKFSKCANRMYPPEMRVAAAKQKVIDLYAAMARVVEGDSALVVHRYKRYIQIGRLSLLTHLFRMMREDGVSFFEVGISFEWGENQLERHLALALTQRAELRRRLARIKVTGSPNQREVATDRIEHVGAILRVIEISLCLSLEQLHPEAQAGSEKTRIAEPVRQALWDMVPNNVQAKKESFCSREF